MKWQRLGVANYKSITSMQYLNLEDRFTTILGKNGSGKSNLLAAIRLFFACLEKPDDPSFDTSHFEARFLLSEAELQVLASNAPYQGKNRYIDLIIPANKHDEAYLKCYASPSEVISFFNSNHFLVRWIKEALSVRCFYLDYEHSVLFAPDRNPGLLGQDARRSIETCFLRYAQKEGLINEEQKSLELSQYDESYQEKLRQQFENFIHAHRPRFEHDSYRDFKVKIINHQFALYVVEKNGSEVPFADTNLGRRWFFAYLFIRETLQADDFFVIDEPASFLHPEAQMEIRKDLESLAAQGVHVLFTTHSPYMISAQIKHFLYVTMAQNGTRVRRFKTDQLHIARDEMKMIDFSHVFLNLTKTYILVEGKTDVACLKRFIDFFDLDDTKYEILQLGGAGNMKGIDSFFNRNHLPHIRLLDADQEAFYLTNREHIVFVGHGFPEKRLEGIFAPIDRRRYFSGEKVSAEKIAKSQRFAPETIKNFAKLFIEMGLLPEDYHA